MSKEKKISKFKKLNNAQLIVMDSLARTRNSLEAEISRPYKCDEKNYAVIRTQLRNRLEDIDNKINSFLKTGLV